MTLRQSSGSRRMVALTAGLTTMALAAGAAATAEAMPTPEHRSRAAIKQPVLSTRDVPIITVRGLKFRDLDRNGRLTPYEDWRLTPAQRAADLLDRMTPEQKAGLLVHSWKLPQTATGFDLDYVRTLVADRHMNTMITSLAVEPRLIAEATNSVQAIAEEQPLAIPVAFSTDPRNGFAVATGMTVARVGTTAMPDAIGLGAAGDPKLTRKLSEIVRQEYRSMGFQIALSPQADLATEPRWTRINGTFGSDWRAVGAQVAAYVSGLQGSDHGVTTSGVATVTKHWAGYGAQDKGYDSHYYYGRYATFPGGNFATHLKPFEGAFAAHTTGIMPTYAILKDLVYKGTAVEQVGVGYSKFMLTDLLRGQYGFDGVVTSDWAITGDCPLACQEVRPPAKFVGPWGVGMPWGVENLTRTERVALAINAGVDQLGGLDEPSYVLDALSKGLLTQARVDESALRVLKQKFELGLFEHPFVDPDAAAAIAGNAKFKKVGDAAQAQSLTLLKNAKNLLPLKAGTTVYLNGIAKDEATAQGLTVVDDPTKADVAIVRLADPRSGADLTGLDFTGQEADYQAFQAAVDAGVPTVAVPKLDRPLVLTDVVRDAAAVLANYGVSDEVLLETLLGDRKPGGHLPFELPSSMAAVEAQQGDVADDTADPLFKRGFGLDYRGCWKHGQRGCGRK